MVGGGTNGEEVSEEEGSTRVECDETGADGDGAWRPLKGRVSVGLRRRDCYQDRDSETFRQEVRPYKSLVGRVWSHRRRRSPSTESGGQEHQDTRDGRVREVGDRNVK